MVDSQPGQLYDNVCLFAFSPDSRRIAYVAETTGWWFLVVDGKPGPAYDEVDDRFPSDEHRVFSPDSRHVAYVARRNKEWFVVLDSLPGPAFDEILGGGFSSDGHRFAYVGKKTGKSFMVVDGRVEPACDEIYGGPSFSADGSLQWLARVGNMVCRMSVPALKATKPMRMATIP